MTLGTWVTEWLDDHAKREVSTRTFERYSELLRLHVVPRIGGILLRQVAPADIQRLYHGLLDDGRKVKPRKARDDGKAAPAPAPQPAGLAARTVIHAHRVLSRCLSDAARLRLLDHNPVKDVKPPRLKRPSTAAGAARVDMTILDRDGLGKLLGGIKDGTTGQSKILPFALALLALDSCGRRGELLALRWCDFNADARTVRIDRAVDDTRADGIRIKDTPKNESSRRTVTISARTASVLAGERQRQQTEQKPWAAIWLRMP